MSVLKSNYKVINMCDFCENEFGSCGASPIFGYEIDTKQVGPHSLDSIIACDKYENPVTAILNSY